MIPKIILKGIQKEGKNNINNKKNIIYVSPDNIETLMSAIILKDYRPFILNQTNPKYQSELKKIIELYEHNKLDNYKIALVRTKDLLSTEKNYNLDFNIEPYFINNDYISFGEHTIEELKQYFEPKNLEQRIYSDSHLIE
ncbi:MAG: hypothetical protein QXK76_04255 [Candidatus Woesearchaeota archaeon]